MIILSRVKEVKGETEADYGVKETFIPLEYIDNMSLFKDAEIENLQNLQIEVDKSTLTVKVGNEYSKEKIEKLVK